jgi:transcriptional regulator with GAF, ATPase, and Fis domain
MSAEALLEIAQRWARTYAPPRALLLDLHAQLKATCPDISALRLLKPQHPDYAVEAATEDARGGDWVTESGNFTLSELNGTSTPQWSSQHHVWYAAISASPDAPLSAVLEAYGLAANPTQADVNALSLTAKVIATALDLREFARLQADILVLDQKSPARDTMNERLRFTVNQIGSARDLGQMAAIIARQMLASDSDVLAINELSHAVNGAVSGWKPIPDNSGTVNPRRSRVLNMPWMDLSAELRARLARGEPVAFESLDAEVKAALGARVFEQMVEWGVSSTAFFPVSLNDRSIAVMIVMRGNGAALSQDAFAAFTSLATHVGSFIASMRRNRDSASVQSRIHQMDQLSTRLGMAENFDDVTLAIVDLLPTTTQRVVLVLFNEPAPKDLLPAYVSTVSVVSGAGSEHGYGDNHNIVQNAKASQLFNRLHISPVTTLEKMTSQAAQHLFGATWERLGTAATSAALIPLRIEDKYILGVIIVAGSNIDHLRSISHQLRDIADRATPAIEQLVRQRNETFNQPEQLASISESLTQANGRIEEMRLVRDLLPFHVIKVAWVALELDPEAGSLKKYAIESVIERDNRQQLLDIGLLEIMDASYRRKLLKQAERDHEPVRIWADDLPYDEDVVLNELIDFDNQHPQNVVSGAIVLGLAANRRLIGHLYILSSDPLRDRPDIRVLCRQIGTILSLKECVRMAKPKDFNQGSPGSLLAELNNLSVLLNKTRDEQALLQQLTQLLVERFEIQHAAVLLPNPDSSATFRAEYPASGLKDHRLAANHALLPDIKSNASHTIVDTSANPAIDAGFKRMLDKARIGRTIWIPMLDSGDKWMGAVAINLQSADQEFSIQAMSSAKPLIFQVATLLESLRQVEESRRQISQLKAMTQLSQQIVSASTQSDVYFTVVSGIRSVLPAEHATVFQADSRTGLMHLKALLSDGKAELVDTATAFNTDKTPAGAAATTGQLHNLPDLAQWQNGARAAMSDAMTSSLAAPIRVLGDIIGALEVDARQAHAFDEGDLNIFEQLVLQIEAGLTRSAMISGGERAATTASSITAVDQALSTETATSGTIQRAANETRRILKAEQVRIRLDSPSHLNPDSGQ